MKIKLLTIIIVIVCTVICSGCSRNKGSIEIKVERKVISESTIKEEEDKVGGKSSNGGGNLTPGQLSELAGEEALPTTREGYSDTEEDVENAEPDEEQAEIEAPAIPNMDSGYGYEGELNEYSAKVFELVTANIIGITYTAKSVSIIEDYGYQYCFSADAVNSEGEQYSVKMFVMQGLNGDLHITDIIRL